VTEHALWRSVEVRVAAEARTLDALLVPYDEVTYDVPDPRGERFARGAFADFITDWQGAEGKRSRRPVPFFRNHQHDRAAGVARSLAETPDGPVGSFRIPDTPFGNEVLAEYREGLLDGISVGFYALEETRDDEGVRVITKARLVEASAVVLGAYQSARVLAVRSKQAPRFALPKAPRVDPHGWLA
jgi:HK97 family phage prohead protease